MMAQQLKVVCSSGAKAEKSEHLISIAHGQAAIFGRNTLPGPFKRDARFSREHFRIDFEVGRILVTHLSKTNGTTLVHPNGVKEKLTSVNETREAPLHSALLAGQCYFMLHEVSDFDTIMETLETPASGEARVELAFSGEAAATRSPAFAGDDPPVHDEEKERSTGPCEVVPGDRHEDHRQEPAESPVPEPGLGSPPPFRLPEELVKVPLQEVSSLPEEERPTNKPPSRDAQPRRPRKNTDRWVNSIPIPPMNPALPMNPANLVGPEDAKEPVSPAAPEPWLDPARPKKPGAGSPSKDPVALTQPKPEKLPIDLPRSDHPSQRPKETPPPMSGPPPRLPKPKQASPPPEKPSPTAPPPTNPELGSLDLDDDDFVVGDNDGPDDWNPA